MTPMLQVVREVLNNPVDKTQVSAAQCNVWCPQIGRAHGMCGRYQKVPKTAPKKPPPSTRAQRTNMRVGAHSWVCRHDAVAPRRLGCLAQPCMAEAGTVSLAGCMVLIKYGPDTKHVPASLASSQCESLMPYQFDPDSSWCLPRSSSSTPTSRRRTSSAETSWTALRSSTATSTCTMWWTRPPARTGGEVGPE